MNMPASIEIINEMFQFEQSHYLKIIISVLANNAVLEKTTLCKTPFRNLWNRESLKNKMTKNKKTLLNFVDHG